MYTSETESLLRYYNAELQYLRRMSGAFAERYPRIASRLELSADNCADPSVERMIESFAFLTARIQKRIDAEFPQITASLLGILYPHLVSPAPPMSIARFDVDPEQGKITTGFPVAAGTQLFAETAGGFACRFRTCYPVTLWPLQVEEAALEPAAQFEFLDSYAGIASVLRIRLTCPGALMEDFQIDRLRFHIAGEPTLVSTMYELLFAHSKGILIKPMGAKNASRLPDTSPEYVGFEPDEAVLPTTAHALPAYRLLQEYFLFPEKYHFFDIRRLAGHLRGGTCDLLFLLDKLPPHRFGVDRRNFVLGCTPIVNLFPRTTEPIRLDQRQHEYLLEPDIRRARTTELHTITGVTSTPDPAEATTQFEPLFSFRHRSDGRTQRAFWYARRGTTARPQATGTDMWMSFVDLDMNPALPPVDTVYAHGLCTNRDFAVQLPSGALMQTEDKVPVVRISCLNRPTPPVYPPVEGRTIWYLVSGLSLNYLSLADNAVSAESLREILRLYSFGDSPSAFQQVEGIRAVSCRPVSRRIGKEPWRGFCRGHEVTIRFDESMYVGSGAFLMGAVLNRFLALYTAVNSFTELVMESEQREGIWKRWPAASGLQELL